MRQTIRLTESELRQMIEESVNQALLEEGFGDQLWQGTKAFFGKGDMGKKNAQRYGTRSGNAGFNFAKRANAFKQNFQSQGVIDDSNDIINKIDKLVKNGIVTWNNTLGELWGALNRQKAKATKAGSQAQNKMYQ